MECETTIPEISTKVTSLHYGITWKERTYYRTNTSGDKHNTGGQTGNPIDFFSGLACGSA